MKQLMLEDRSEFFTKAINDIAGALIGCCTFQHNSDPYSCQCRFKFGHKGQHECYDRKCPFTWVDKRKPNPDVLTFQDSLVYCSVSSLQTEIAIAKA